MISYCLNSIYFPVLDHPAGCDSSSSIIQVVLPLELPLFCPNRYKSGQVLRGRTSIQRRRPYKHGRRWLQWLRQTTFCRLSRPFVTSSSRSQQTIDLLAKIFFSFLFTNLLAVMKFIYKFIFFLPFIAAQNPICPMCSLGPPGFGQTPLPSLPTIIEAAPTFSSFPWVRSTFSNNTNRKNPLSMYQGDAAIFGSELGKAIAQRIHQLYGQGGTGSGTKWAPRIPNYDFQEWTVALLILLFRNLNDQLQSHPMEWKRFNWHLQWQKPGHWNIQSSHLAEAVRIVLEITTDMDLTWDMAQVLAMPFLLQGRGGLSLLRRKGRSKSKRLPRRRVIFNKHIYQKYYLLWHSGE